MKYVELTAPFLLGFGLTSCVVSAIRDSIPLAIAAGAIIIAYGLCEIARSEK